MKAFVLDKDYIIIGMRERTRNGFKHVATLLKNGIERDNTKVCYLNRTWESFEYETVSKKLIEQYFTSSEHKEYFNKLKKA